MAKYHEVVESESIDSRIARYDIVLFDGVCNLCNGAVDFIIKRDKKNKFLFASLQSDFGQEILEKYGLQSQSFDSFLFLTKDRVYQKSTAALRVAKKLNGFWALLYGFMIVPKFLRDAVYSWIAKNRYKWFGKKETCRLPTPRERAKFIE